MNGMFLAMNKQLRQRKKKVKNIRSPYELSEEKEKRYQKLTIKKKKNRFKLWIQKKEVK